MTRDVCTVTREIRKMVGALMASVSVGIGAIISTRAVDLYTQNRLKRPRDLRTTNALGVEDLVEWVSTYRVRQV